MIHKCVYSFSFAKKSTISRCMSTEKCLSLFVWNVHQCLTQFDIVPVIIGSSSSPQAFGLHELESGEYHSSSSGPSLHQLSFLSLFFILSLNTPTTLTLLYAKTTELKLVIPYDFPICTILFFPGYIPRVAVRDAVIQHRFVKSSNLTPHNHKGVMLSLQHGATIAPHLPGTWEIGCQVISYQSPQGLVQTLRSTGEAQRSGDPTGQVRFISLSGEEKLL